MEWYNILFYISIGVFIIKSIITILCDDTDIEEFYEKKDMPFDLNSLFSINGGVDFLFGFSTYLFCITKIDMNYDYILNSIYYFSLDQYVFAIGFGILVSWVLFYFYKYLSKLKFYNSEYFDVNNYNCTIISNNGLVDIDEPAPDKSGHDHAYSYTVFVNTEIGTKKIIVLSKKGDLEIGSEHKIYMNEEGIYYIS